MAETPSEGLTQRDLLVRLDTRVEDFLKRLDDHEQRIRVLEKSDEGQNAGVRVLRWVIGLGTALVGGGAADHYLK